MDEWMCDKGPVRRTVELQGNVADNIPGWAADVNADAARNAGYACPVTKSVKTPVAEVPVAPLANSELDRLVTRLKSLPVNASAHKFDKAAICEVLEAIEKIPLTTQDLRETQLGVLTQPYKDSPDPQVQMIARRLRKSWKAVVQSSEG